MGWNFQVHYVLTPKILHKHLVTDYARMQQIWKYVTINDNTDLRSKIPNFWFCSQDTRFVYSNVWFKKRLKSNGVKKKDAVLQHIYQWQKSNHHLHQMFFFLSMNYILQLCIYPAFYYTINWNRLTVNSNGTNLLHVNLCNKLIYVCIMCIKYVCTFPFITNVYKRNYTKRRKFII